MINCRKRSLRLSQGCSPNDHLWGYFLTRGGRGDNWTQHSTLDIPCFEVFLQNTPVQRLNWFFFQSTRLFLLVVLWTVSTSFLLYPVYIFSDHVTLIVFCGCAWNCLWIYVMLLVVHEAEFKHRLTVSIMMLFSLLYWTAYALTFLSPHKIYLPIRLRFSHWRQNMLHTHTNRDGGGGRRLLKLW